MEEREPTTFTIGTGLVNLTVSMGAFWLKFPGVIAGMEWLQGLTAGIAVLIGCVVGFRSDIRKFPIAAVIASLVSIIVGGVLYERLTASAGLSNASLVIALCVYAYLFSSTSYLMTVLERDGRLRFGPTNRGQSSGARKTH
jgi:hypothetical protein